MRRKKKNKKLILRPSGIRAEILFGAANLLEKDGWCQGRPYDGQKCCAVGAITKFVEIFNNHDHDDKFAEENYYRQFLAQKNSLGLLKIITWNDDPNQTKENVISGLRSAAKKYGIKYASEVQSLRIKI